MHIRVPAVHQVAIAGGLIAISSCLLSTGRGLVAVSAFLVSFREMLVAIRERPIISASL